MTTIETDSQRQPKAALVAGLFGLLFLALGTLTFIGDDYLMLGQIISIILVALTAYGLIDAARKMQGQVTLGAIGWVLFLIGMILANGADLFGLYLANQQADLTIAKIMDAIGLLAGSIGLFVMAYALQSPHHTTRQPT